MNLKQRINDLSEAVEHMESEKNTISGVLTQSQLTEAEQLGCNIGGVLVVPDPVSKEEWIEQMKNGGGQ